MLTPRQIRAARGLLGWEAIELGRRTDLSRETIANIESGRTQAREGSLERIAKALADGGVEFTADEGVKIRRGDLIKYEGVDGFKEFLDNVYSHVKDTTEKAADNEPVCSSSINDKDFIRHLGDYFTFHINRMTALKNFKHRILLKEKPASLQPKELNQGGYREYRKRSPHDTANVAFYVYGDKLAILMLAAEVPQIVVISSSLVAQGYREIFNALWQMAKPFD